MRRRRPIRFQDFKGLGFRVSGSDADSGFSGVYVVVL